MLFRLFQEVTQIRDAGSLTLIFDFDNNRKHNTVNISIIQFIIGDYKGYGIICGRKGGHSPNMKTL